jgi:hypothetical protein
MLLIHFLSQPQQSLDECGDDFQIFSNYNFVKKTNPDSKKLRKEEDEDVDEDEEEEKETGPCSKKPDRLAPAISIPPGARPLPSIGLSDEQIPKGTRSAP